MQRFSRERREIIVFSGFRLHEPGMSTFDAEVVAEFVGGEGGEHFFLRRGGRIGKDMWGA
jgi:hypothetical protein